jgi:hypothetical protein
MSMEESTCKREGKMEKWNNGIVECRFKSTHGYSIPIFHHSIKNDKEVIS